MAEVTAPPRFDMRGVSKRFGATLALDGVDLAVRGGEVCALVGQNGAGKSTLMSILSGALAPDAGTMTIDGARYAPASPLEGRRAGVAMIYQALSLAPHLTVAENIALGVEPARAGFVRRAEMRRRAAAALAEIGHADLPVDAPAGGLGPGAQQIVEIARALATGCRVLVLDEPTSSLAHDDVARLFGLIARLKAQGHAIVYISHFIEEVQAVSDRFVVLRDGRVAGEGATAPATASAIVSLMVGRRVEELYPPRRPSAASGAPPLLDVRDLQPGGATFAIARGEVLGIAGLVGAGRTELLRAIFGLAPIARGEVRVGVWRGAAPPSARWRQGAGLVSEDRGGEGLAASMTVADNLTLTRLDGPLGGRVVSRARQAEAARRWIDRLGIRTAGPRQRVSELSGGNQQKVAIARLLHHDVDLLLLDEPTRGIDLASKAQIYALVDALVSTPAADGRGAKAVLIVSSYFPELLGLCDRIAVMSRGRLGDARPASAWTEHALLMAASGAGSARAS